MAAGDFVSQLGGNIKQQWVVDINGEHHLSAIPTGLDASGNPAAAYLLDGFDLEWTPEQFMMTCRLVPAV